MERILVDPSDSGMALAVLSGRGPRVFRTITGNFWDVLDGNLPEAAVHSIAADRSAGAVYVATDKGVFYGRTDLLNASQPAVSGRISLPSFRTPLPPMFASIPQACSSISRSTATGFTPPPRRTARAISAS